MKLDSLPPTLSASLSATPKSRLPLPQDIPDSLPILNSEAAELSLSRNPARCQEHKKLRQKHWVVFASTFTTIFLAEVGDKTQIAILLMTAQSHNPWIVFAGAGLALVAASLLGVLLGRWLASRIAPRTLEKAAGAILLAISAMLLWDVLH